MHNTITVKVIRAPGLVRNVTIPEGSNVSTALNAAGTYLRDGEKPEVNGRSGDANTLLNNGDTIIMAFSAKGAVHSVDVVDQTYVNGTPVDSLSLEDFLSFIALLDAEANRIIDLGIGSPVIEHQLKKIADNRAQLIELMEKFHSPKDEA